MLKLIRIENRDVARNDYAGKGKESIPNLVNTT